MILLFLGCMDFNLDGDDYHKNDDGDDDDDVDVDIDLLKR